MRCAINTANGPKNGMKRNRVWNFARVIYALTVR